MAAWLPCPAVHEEGILERSHIPACSAVIADGTSTFPDGQQEHVDQRLVQGLEPFGRDITALCVRPNPCPEQAFVRVDIAHACQHVLIEQERFYRLAGTEEPREVLRRQLQRFRPQPSPEVLFV